MNVVTKAFKLLEMLLFIYFLKIFTNLFGSNGLYLKSLKCTTHTLRKILNIDFYHNVE